MTNIWRTKNSSIKLMSSLIIPTILVAILGLAATSSGGIWFTIFAAILGGGIGWISSAFVQESITKDIAEDLRKALVPSYRCCFHTRDEANKEGYDLRWALDKARKHFVIIGLTSGSLHTAFRVPLRAALARGVNVDIYILDKNNPAVLLRQSELANIDGTKTKDNIDNSIEKLTSLCGDVNFRGMTGRLTVRGYSVIPFFEVVAIDCEEKNVDSMMLITHTLFNKHTNSSPTWLLDISSSLFLTYLCSIRSLTTREDNTVIASNVT